MGEFNAGERGRGRAETLQSQHGRAALFDGAMVLLDHVVEIAAHADIHTSPAEIFCRQQAQPAVHGAVAIDIDLRWPRHALLADRHAEECLRRLHGAIVAEQ
jgi:hypothetical protein